MPHQTKLTFFTLLLMISFASVNAVLFTPALPAIANYFAISENVAQLTITWFLVGYAVGQLIYGPIANRFGRKPALYGGILLQIASCLLCVEAGNIHSFALLVVGRFIMALGAGVGLKMTFTLVNETYTPVAASKKIAYLMMAFAITPGLGVVLGGYLISHFEWTSTFYASAIYGFILLMLVTQLTETKTQLNMDALKWNHLLHGYLTQFKNKRLLTGAFLMGGATSFVYVFAALAPFIAINNMHMKVSDYSAANLIPAVGLVLGSLLAAQLAKLERPIITIAVGIMIALLGSATMLVLVLMQYSPVLSLFIPMMICYFGLALVNSNASTVAMSHAADKAHGSAVMSFINMGVATVLVLSLGGFSIYPLLLPMIYILISISMAVLNTYLSRALI